MPRRTVRCRVIGRYRIEILANQSRDGFSCGVEALDRYLLRQAGQDQRRQVAVVYLLMEADRVVGYYTLATTGVTSDVLPENMRKALPKYRILPAAIIGRLAVDQRYRRQGLGAFLLMDALHHCVRTSKEMGFFAVVVDAKDDNARAFYEAFNFRRCLDDEHHLFRPISELKRLFEPAER